MISSMQIWWSGANKLWPVYQLWQTHYKLRTSQFTVKYINDSVWPVINNISRGWWRLVSSINTLQNLKDIQYVLQVWLKTSSRPLNWDTAMTAKTKLRTHCNAAMFAPSRWGGSAAATSALGNTRFDKYYIGLELRCPQPLQGLEGVEDLHTTEQTGEKSDMRGESQQWCIRLSTQWADLMWLPALIQSANRCSLQDLELMTCRDSALWYIWMYIKQDVLRDCNMTPTSGCTSTTHILFLACTERIASILVPYWFSLYSPCSMNLETNVQKFYCNESSFCGRRVQMAERTIYFWIVFHGFML